MLPIAVTMGEPAGIGGEILAKAWRRHDLPVFFAIDDPDRLAALAPVRVISAPDEAASCFADALPVLPCPLARRATPGRIDPANSPAVIASIDRAVALVRAGSAGAVVTNPIQKSALQAAGFAHPGHTEYLAELAGGGIRPVMMLAIEGLRVVPITIHLALAEAIRRLDGREIVETARIVDADLKRRFGIARPRLAFSGLNPHAGEDGRMGHEEIEIIAPAIEQLRQEGIDARGPVPADTMFHAKAREGYDVALCMYHDQALIPLKTLDFAGGVNITLGLPFIRTSPDHGTALDIAGTGTADDSSLVAAIGLAGRLVA